MSLPEQPSLGTDNALSNLTWSELQDYCASQPSSPECADVDSFYQYPLSLAANATFLAIFALSFLLYLAVYFWKKGRGLAFTAAMTLGCVCEILGYTGRIMGWDNRFDANGFLMQICCLTIGPAFMAAGIYLCLRRIVYAFGPGGSRIRPEAYTRVVS